MDHCHCCPLGLQGLQLWPNFGPCPQECIRGTFMKLFMMFMPRLPWVEAKFKETRCLNRSLQVLARLILDVVPVGCLALCPCQLACHRGLGHWTWLQILPSGSPLGSLADAQFRMDLLQHLEWKLWQRQFSEIYCFLIMFPMRIYLKTPPYWGYPLVI